MVAIKSISVVAFVASVFASPVINTSDKAFKIGVTFKNKETLYITNTSIASPNIADGVSCSITDNKIACGPEKKAFTYSEVHSANALQLVPSDDLNTNWSIGDDNEIHWGTRNGGMKWVAFSRIKGNNPKNIYAEVCSTNDHHDIFPGLEDFWQRGDAKAYYV